MFLFHHHTSKHFSMLIKTIQNNSIGCVKVMAIQIYILDLILVRTLLD